MDTNALNELVEGILAIFNTQVIRIEMCIRDRFRSRGTYCISS